MKRTLAQSLVLILLGSAASASQFYCKVNSIQALSASGTLTENDMTKVDKDLLGTLSYDEDTGFLNVGSIRWQLKTIQAGTAENSLLATRMIYGPARAVMQTLRIETFSTNAFLFTWDGEVWTGTCIEK